MRIAVLATCTVDGGAEKYLRSLHPALRAIGAEPHLFGVVPGWEETDIPATSVGAGPKWTRTTVLRSLRRAYFEQRKALDVLEEHHRQRPFDLFLAQYKREQIMLSGPLSKLAPVIWTEHGRLVRGAYGALQNHLYRRAARDVAAVICVSESIRNDIASLCGPDTPRLEVISNPVDVARFHPASPYEKTKARQELGLATCEGPVIATVSRLHPTKRVDLAIDAVRRIPGANLVVAGDGSDRPRLERLAATSATLFLGHVSQVETVLHAADVFLFTSSEEAREGLPTMAMLEAAASGLPTVAVQGAGLDQNQQPGPWDLVPPDPEAISTRLRLVLANSQGHAARAWAERQAVRPWAERHMELFVDTCAMPRREAVTLS